MGSPRHERRSKTHATRRLWVAKTSQGATAWAAVDFILTAGKPSHLACAPQNLRSRDVNDLLILNIFIHVCARRFSRSRTHGSSKVVRKSELRLGRAQANRQLPPISFKACNPRRANGQAI